MDIVVKLLVELGVKGGVGLLSLMLSLGLLTGQKLNFSDLGASLENQPAAVLAGVLLAILGAPLLVVQIHEVRKDSEKRQLEAERQHERAANEHLAKETALEAKYGERAKGLETALATLQTRASDLSEEDRRTLADLVTQFASHRMLYLPIHYENIADVMTSVQRLRVALLPITSGKGLGLARIVGQRAESILQDFSTKADRIQALVEEEIRYKIKAMEDGRINNTTGELEKYKNLVGPIFSHPYRVVITGSADLDMLRLNEGYALEFVSAFAFMRGRFQEILALIEREGVPIPEQLKRVY